MTSDDPRNPATPAGDERVGEPLAPDAPADESPRPPRPGAGIFTIEGRAAPGLFVVGWLITILGAGVLAIGFAGQRGVASTLLVLAGLVLLSLGLIAVSGAQAIERRARDAKERLELRLARAPVLVERGDDELVLGLEEVVEAALLDVRSLADRIDAGRAVALQIQEIDGGLDQPLPRRASSPHGRI